MERRGVCPASDGEEDLELPVLLLQLVDRLEVAVEIVSLVVPGVAWVMDLLVGP